MPALKSFIVTRDRPVADLVAERLRELPTVFGQLIYLARCAGAGGRYVHEGLRMTHDRAAISRALAEAHERCFEHWLALSLAAQHQDVSAFLDGPNRHRALQAWRKSDPWTALCPRTADAAQRDLFSSDLRAVLTTLLQPSASGT